MLPKAQAEQTNEADIKRKRESPRDHSGEEYGDLKILRLDPNADRGNAYICRCKNCGWEGSVRLDSITKYGRTNRCDCYEREGIIGKTIGDLQILRRDLSVQNVPPSKYMYICRCIKCGWEGSVRYDAIKKYGTAKCNCKKEKSREYDTTSLIGKPYGDLVVIGFGEYRKGKNSLWKCQCKCGNIILVPKHNLEKGSTTRCRQCANKIIAAKNHTNKVEIGEVICNNDDPERSVTIIAYDHYNPDERKHYWRWRCNFCGNEGVTNEHGLRNFSYICAKCANIINVKRIQPKFARLTPIKLVEHNGLKWLCKCDCGNTIIVNTTDLQYGKIQSCGCIRFRDIKAETPIENYPPNLKGRLQAEYWSMHDRCFSPNHKAYDRNNVKGITICDRWLGEDGVKHFIEDMGPTYQPHLTLDRVDNSKGYSPDNCRWATHKEQQNNRDNNRAIIFRGKEYASVQLLLDEFINAGYISLSDERSKSAYICSRLNNGWTIEEAITIPPESYQHPDTVHNTTISYKDEWKKAHPNINIETLEKPIKSAIVFTKDRTDNYFEDKAKTNHRSMFYRIIPDPNKQ